MDYMERTQNGAVSVMCGQGVSKKWKTKVELEQSDYRNALSEERKCLLLHFTHLLGYEHINL